MIVFFEKKKSKNSIVHSLHHIIFSIPVQFQYLPSELSLVQTPTYLTKTVPISSNDCKSPTFSFNTD